MSDISAILSGGETKRQNVAGAAVTPLPSLPYLRQEESSRASDSKACAASGSGPCKENGSISLNADRNMAPAAGAADLERAAAEAVMRRLPVQGNQRQDMEGIVRTAVDAAVRAYLDKGGAAAAAPPSVSGGESGCAACGACSAPGFAAPAASGVTPGPERTFAGTVTAVDATRLAFGRFPGAPDSVVNIVDVITPRDGSPMGGGYLEWNALSFPWRLTYAEIDVVLEGELHITSGGQTVIGRPGDMLFIPKDTDVIFSSPGRVRFAYVTWPAEWSATIDQPGGGS